MKTGSSLCRSRFFFYTGISAYGFSASPITTPVSLWLAIV